MFGLDSAISLFFTHFYNPLKNQVNYLLHVRSNVDQMEGAAEELKNRKEDVKQMVQLAVEQQQQSAKREVQGWMDQVEAKEREVAAVLKDYRARSKCCGGYPVNCWSGYRIGRRTFKKQEELVQLKTKGAFPDGVGMKALPNPVIEQPTTATVGADLMLRRIMKYIREDNIGIIGVHGLGGVGKTTLLRKINNEFLGKSLVHEFDYVIWTVVSEGRSIDDLQKNILERLGQKYMESTQARAAAIFKCLNKKKFLLFLDDIWDNLDLESLGVPVPQRGDNKKQQVIFTTRFEWICAKMDAHERMKVECLKWEEAWKLFREKVGEKTIDASPSIQRFAKKVARKCGGLPLALVVMGKAMSTKKTVEEWENALTTLTESQSDTAGIKDELFSLLKLSYYNLPNDRIRECFSTFALYPEDYVIVKNHLIRYWMDLGLFDEFDDTNKAYRNGHKIIGILIEACLLECRNSRGQTKVAMHDVNREMAIWIANKCGKKNKWIVLAGAKMRELRYTNEWRDAERLSLIKGSVHNGDIKPGFFEYMTTLQYLDLSGSYICSLPSDIGMLVQLRYLSLVGTPIRSLPEEMGDLEKLEWFDVSHTDFLRTIPRGLISKLQSLRRLRLRNTGFKNWEVEGSTCPGDIAGAGLEEFERLKMLKSLSIKAANWRAFEWLVTSQLPIQQLELECTDGDYIVRLPSTNPWSTKIMEGLYELALSSWDNEEFIFGSSDWCLSALNRLVIAYAFRTNSIVWRAHPSECLPNLQKVYFFACEKLKSASWLTQLPQLRELSIVWCDELECVVEEESEQAFHELESLCLRDLPKLISVCSDAVAFPSLVSLEITDCNILRRFPAGILSVHRQIKTVLGVHEELEKLPEWREEEEGVLSHLLSLREERSLSNPPLFEEFSD